MHVVDVVVGVLALVGAALVALAGIGVVRLGDVYARMHAASKASTLGLALIGAAAALAIDDAAAKVGLAVLFTFLTAPSAAHLVGRAAHGAEGIELDLEGPDDLGDLQPAGAMHVGQREIELAVPRSLLGANGFDFKCVT